MKIPPSYLTTRPGSCTLLSNTKVVGQGSGKVKCMEKYIKTNDFFIHEQLWVDWGTQSYDP